MTSSYSSYPWQDGVTEVDQDTMSTFERGLVSSFGTDVPTSTIRFVPDTVFTVTGADANNMIWVDTTTADRVGTLDKQVNSTLLTGASVRVYNAGPFTVFLTAVAGVTVSNLPRAVGPDEAVDVIQGVNDKMAVIGGQVTAAAPVLLAAPVLSAPSTGFRTGTIIDADNGTWNIPVTSFRYQWQQDTAGNGTFVDIGSATSKTYTLLVGQVGNQVRRETWATTNGNESTVAYSNAQTALAAAGSKPVASSPSLAIIPSSPQLGDALTISTVQGWTNNPTSFRYQWQKNTGGGMADIGAATATGVSAATLAAISYTPTTADPHQLKVWASNAAGEAVTAATSNSVTPATQSTTINALLASDMTNASEHLPSLNPSWSFVADPDSVAWNTSNLVWNAWGQLAPGVEGNPSACKVEIGDLQLNLWNGTQWVTVLYNQFISSSMGSLFNASTYQSTGTPTITTSPNGRSLIALTGTSPFWHFWTSAFYDLNNLNNLVNKNNFQGGYSAFRARLDPTTPLLHATANYVGSAAADQRSSTGQTGTIPNIGIGRWKAVTASDQWFTMTFDSSRKTAAWSDSAPLPTGYQGEFGGTPIPSGGGGGTAPPSLDAILSPSIFEDSTGTGIISGSATLPSGSNRLLICALASGSNNIADVVQVNGVHLTRLQTQSSTTNSNSRKVDLWYMVAPPTGSCTVQAYGGTAPNSFGGAIDMQVLSFSGVSQSSPFGTAVGAYTDAGTSLDVSTTGGSTSDLILAVSSVKNATSVAPDSSQTTRWQQLRGTNMYHAGSTQAGSTGTAHSIFTWTGSDRGAALAVALKAA